MRTARPTVRRPHEAASPEQVSYLLDLSNELAGRENTYLSQNRDVLGLSSFQAGKLKKGQASQAIRRLLKDVERKRDREARDAERQRIRQERDDQREREREARAAQARENRSKAAKARWAAMTPEQKNARLEAMQRGRRRS